MSQNNEKYDFSTKESQYLLKSFSEKLYEILEYLEDKDRLIGEKDKLIEEQAIELQSLTNTIKILQEDNSKLNFQVLQFSELNKPSLLERVLRKIYRVLRKILQKVYHLMKKIFRKRD